jgi:hypothetical protein
MNMYAITGSYCSGIICVWVKGKKAATKAAKKLKRQGFTVVVERAHKGER